LKTPHGLKFPYQARFHPLKYITGLHKVLHARGVKLHPDTAITEIEEKGGSVELVTDRGLVIRAKAAVIATNAFAHLSSPHPA
jgi:glycine/D-amino acid oxidase-like deaminating enzyme